MWLMILLLAPFLLIFLYFFVALIICYKWDTPKRNYVMAKKLPGPKTLPIIGLALDIALLKPHGKSPENPILQLVHIQDYHRWR